MPVFVPDMLFGVHAGYTHRFDNSFYDDTGNTDFWQREVYQHARSLFDREHLRSVCDIGCGSAYKLMHQFPDVKTVGIDLPSTVQFLRARYPDHVWHEYDKVPNSSFDLVIAADVIEHTADPDSFLMRIAAMKPRWLVLSTPERDMLPEMNFYGPPTNPSHVREWSYREFSKYVSRFFKVAHHFISNQVQSTQCMICLPL